jgi:hypothetical protein
MPVVLTRVVQAQLSISGHTGLTPLECVVITGQTFQTVRSLRDGPFKVSRHFFAICLSQNRKTRAALLHPLGPQSDLMLFSKCFAYSLTYVQTNKAKMMLSNEFKIE